MLRTLAVTTALLLTSAGLANAQAARGAPPGYTPPPPSTTVDPTFRLQTREQWDQIRRQKQEQKAAEQQALNAASPEQLARAQRVAELLNASKCQEAAQYAVSQGDQPLAQKVVAICRAPARR